MLEAALKQLFDFQRFERSPALQTVIDEVLARYSGNGLLSLADDDLALAAGGTRTLDTTEKQEPDYDGRGTV